MGELENSGFRRTQLVNATCQSATMRYEHAMYLLQEVFQPDPPGFEECWAEFDYITRVSEAEVCSGKRVRMVRHTENTFRW